MKTSVQVFITTRNRLQSLKKTIDSVLSQTLSDFEIIISDNSTNNETEKFISALGNERLNYVKRLNLGVIEHFNAILTEVSADYFMIFHDDDFMHENMLAKLCNILTRLESVVAVGANAYKNINSVPTKKLFYTNRKDDITIKSADEVVYQYIVKDGIVPFPSYLYKKEIANKLRLDPKKGGESCDVSFIMDITTLGHIIFLAEPLMEYSFHRGQVSAGDLLLGQIKLVNYFNKKTKYKREDSLIRQFRLRAIYCELKDGLMNKRISVFSSRHFSLLKLLFNYSQFEYLLKGVVISIRTKFKLFGY